MENKEQQILLKVREMFFTYGIKSLTMDDVAQHLGISKKTLYQVVTNKAELVDKIIDLTIDERKTGMQCVIKESENAIDEMLQIYRQHAMMQKRINISITFELRKYFPESWDRLESFRNDFIFKCVLNNLQNGQNSGFYRKDMNAVIVAKIYSNRIFDLMNPEIFPQDQFHQEDVYHEMFLYHIHGIASEKGLDYLEKEVTLDF